MRWAWMTLLALTACKAGEGAADADATGDATGAVHSTLPWSQVETSQADCCTTVETNFTWEDVIIDDQTRYIYVMPDDPVGALIVLHGTGGDVGTVRQVEWLELYNLLVPRGIGILLSNSLDRDPGAQWSLAADGSNPDIDRIEEMIGEVAKATAFDVNDPIVTIGFSQGATFSGLLAESLLGRGRDVRGAIMHQGGTTSLSDGIPGLWVSAENDMAGGGPSAHQQVAEAAGAPSAYLLGHEVPLDPRRFAKLSYFDATQSEGMFDILVDEGWFAEDGTRLVDWGDDPNGWCDRNEDRVPVPTAPNSTMSQLRVVWATHRFSAEHKVEEAAWIEARMLE